MTKRIDYQGFIGCRGLAGLTFDNIPLLVGRGLESAWSSKNDGHSRIERCSAPYTGTL